MRYKIAILMNHTPEWDELVEITAENLREYAIRHGYKTYVRKTNPTKNTPAYTSYVRYWN